MKKILLSLLIMMFSLSAAPKAVVFDWGNVIGFHDRSLVVDFMRQSFSFSAEQFEKVNLDKRKAMQAGMSDVEFWLQYAREKQMQLPNDWTEFYTAIIKESVGADRKMYALIDELKKREVRVGLLSNIDDRYTKLIRNFGFYTPFDPCLLSCEMGLEKPDPQVYALLLKTIDLPAEQVVFIDDKAENIDAAKKAGIDAFVFESVEQVRRELAERGLFDHDS